jgi:hypothetical protein
MEGAIQHAAQPARQIKDFIGNIVEIPFVLEMLSVGDLMLFL